MFVCNCNGIREREVAAVIDAGVTRWRDILAEFECTPCCGKCEDDINLIFENMSYFFFDIIKFIVKNF